LEPTPTSRRRRRAASSRPAVSFPQFRMPQIPPTPTNSPRCLHPGAAAPRPQSSCRISIPHITSSKRLIPAPDYCCPPGDSLSSPASPAPKHITSIPLPPIPKSSSETAIRRGRSSISPFSPTDWLTPGPGPSVQEGLHNVLCCARKLVIAAARPCCLSVALFPLPPVNHVWEFPHW
jgi:hypothetical protein